MLIVADGDGLVSHLPGLKLLARQPVHDRRGFLCRLYSSDVATLAGVVKPIAQINHTMTRRMGTVRGMHFQVEPHAETKIVQCIRGEVFDVAVDVRPSSPTYLNWHGHVLSEENGLSLVLPEGFAHGFQTLSDDCELIYCHTAFYEKEYERGLNALDPLLSIRWPLAISDMSDRDRSHPMLTTWRNDG